MPDEFSGVVAALGEDGGAVGKGVGVHEPEPLELDEERKAAMVSNLIDSCGVLGTALTPEQVHRLSGLTGRVDLVFDAQ